jgi:hypothetical protein
VLVGELQRQRDDGHDTATSGPHVSGIRRFLASGKGTGGGGPPFMEEMVVTREVEVV